MNTDTEKIAGILGLEPPRQLIRVRHLLTDSRSLSEPSETLFFAIHSATRDGASFMRSLYERGVRAFVTSVIPEGMAELTDAVIFKVDDPVEALQKIAAYHPDFQGWILAIAGSRGKTTLKEWLFQLMEPLAETARSPRSYNSQIGVPLSLWQLAPTTGLALIEAGVSRRGEMERLRRCIAPRTVILTNIGDAHAEGFSSIGEKAREKVSLAAGEATAEVIYCIDYPLLRNTVEELCRGKRLIGWTLLDEPDAPLRITPSPADGGATRLDYTFDSDGSRVSGSVTIPSEERRDIENGANALAFMLIYGISPEVVESRFAVLHMIGTRLNVSEGVNGCQVVADSYTSDFSSLGPALDFIARRSDRRPRTLILSDLRHESSRPDLYADIAALLARYGVSRFIGVGPQLSAHASFFPASARFFLSTSDLLGEMTPADFADEMILLKGAPEYDFSELQTMLEARTHETVLEVNLDAMIRNYNYFRSAVPAGVGMVAMVKASGYGAGSYEIAKTLQDCGAAYLAVAVLDEGIDLRRAGITMPVMVMNPRVTNYKAMFANRLEPEIYSMDMLRDVIREAERSGVTGYPVHIKLDTGMHRMGFIADELPAVMDLLEEQPFVKARSVFSHLATADCPDMDGYTLLQLNRFEEWTGYMISRSSTPILRHVLNSAGILRFPEHHYDMVRLGIGLYGANTLPPEMERPLDVVSTLRTVIIAIREWEAGETIGYGRRGVLDRPSRIATIPIGYADGMKRAFGCGNALVCVNGKMAPTIGNICMDACMIDVTGIDCSVGDAVEIFGRNASLQMLADAAGTIPYEILTSVSPRVKRVYYRE